MRSRCGSRTRHRSAPEFARIVINTCYLISGPGLSENSDRVPPRKTRRVIADAIMCPSGTSPAIWAAMEGRERWALCDERERWVFVRARTARPPLSDAAMAGVKLRSSSSGFKGSIFLSLAGLDQRSIDI